MTGDLGLVAALVRGFPEWEIALRPAGLHVVTAFWQSADGRHRHYIVAPTPAELLDALRKVPTAVEYGPEPPPAA